MPGEEVFRLLNYRVSQRFIREQKKSCFCQVGLHLLLTGVAVRRDFAGPSWQSVIVSDRSAQGGAAIALPFSSRPECSPNDYY